MLEDKWANYFLSIGRRAVQRAKSQKIYSTDKACQPQRLEAWVDSCLLHRRETPQVFSCETTTAESDSQEYFKHFAPTRLLSERCTHCHKVAHPSVSLPSCTGMLLKMIKTHKDIMDCSQGSSGGPNFDNVGVSDSLEKLSLLNGE